MNTDEKYGRLRCISMGEEGSYLYGPQPFEFIAADSIDVNATVVEIEASVSTGGGPAASIGIGKDTLPRGINHLNKSVMASKQPAVGNKQVMNTLMGEECEVFAYLTIREDKVSFPPCTDYTSFDNVTVKVTRDDHHGSSSTRTQLPDGPLGLAFEICYNSGSDCYRLMIPKVNAQIDMYLQTGTSPWGKNIDSEYDISNNEEKEKVIASFERQIKELNHAIEVYKSSESPLPDSRRSEVAINMDDFQSNTCTYIHEETHATQKFLRLQKALNKLKEEEMPGCLPASSFAGMTASQIIESFQEKENDLQIKFQKYLDNEVNTKLKEDEIAAHSEHIKALQKLIKRISEKNYPN